MHSVAAFIGGSKIFSRQKNDINQKQILSIKALNVLRVNQELLCHLLKSNSIFNTLVFPGAAAQEIVKLVTHQFVPFNNTYIYNGITGSSTTLQL